MLKNKKLLSIISAVTTILVCFLGYSFYLSNSSKPTFSNNGFILSSQSNDNASNALIPEYFDSGQSYENRWPDRVLFKNNAGQEIVVSQKNFVHFSNGNLMALVDGVVIDADSLDRQPLTYYNIKAGHILSKVNDKYEMMSGNTKVDFKSFIWKISSNKYMLVGDNIKFSMGGAEKHQFKTYVEVEFVDGDIVKVGDDTKTYRSLSPDATLTLPNEVSLNLDNKAVFQGDQKLLNLQQMLISSNDNVELSETPQNSNNGNNNNDNNNGNTGNNENSGNTGNNENSGNSGNNNNNNTDGNQGSNGDDKNFDFGISSDGSSTDGDSSGDGLISTTINTPSFNITSFTTNAIGFTAKISVKDSNFLLSKPYSIQVIETSTQRQVAEAGPFPTNQYEITASSEALKPNTEYRMILKAKYKYKDQEYEEEFITRTFVTSDIGLTYEKIMATDSSLTYRVKIDPSSLITGGELVLKSNDGSEIDRQIINKQEGQLGEGQQISFNSLSSNTVYVSSIENIVYDGAQISASFDTSLQSITLKTRPTVGNVVLTLDKIAATFNLSVNGFADPQGGLVRANYQVYLPSNLNTPVESVSKNSVSDQSIKVDGTKIFRNTTYVFRVMYEYNDNEKIVEYATPFTDHSSLTGSTFPNISFTPTNISFDSFSGNIEVNNSSGTLIVADAMTYTVRNSTSVSIPGGTLSITGSQTDATLTIPFSISGLRSTESHVVQLFGTVDLQDGNPKIPNSFLGSFVVTTTAPTPFTVNYDKEASITSRAFRIGVQLGNTTDSSGNVLETEYEAQKIKTLELELYEGTEKLANKKLGSYIVTNTAGNDDSNTIKTKFYDTKTTLNETSFSVNQDRFKPADYTLFVTKTVDYTQFSNTIGVTTATQSFTFRPTVSIPNLDFNNAYITSLVKNRDLPTAKPGLDPDTVVAIDVKPRFDNSNTIINKFKITPYLVVAGGSDIELSSLAVDVTSTGVSLPTTRFELSEGLAYPSGSTPPSGAMINALRRGYTYYFKFTADLDLDGDGTSETTYPLPSATSIAKSTNQVINKQDVHITGLVKSTSTNQIDSRVTVEDVDKTLSTSAIKVTNGSRVDSVNLDAPIAGSPNQYNMSFPVTTGNNVFSYDKRVQFSGASVTSELMRYNYSPVVNIGGMSFNHTLSSTQLDIIVTQPSGSNAFNKIAAYDITLTETSSSAGSSTPESYSFKKVALGAGNKYSIPLASIERLRGKRFKIEVDAYYDDENMVQDNLLSTPTPGDYYTFTSINSSGTSNYLTFDTVSNKLSLSSTTAKNSIFDQVSIDPPAFTLKFKNMIGSTSTNSISYSNKFLTLNGKMNASDSNSVNFFIKKLSVQSIPKFTGSSNDISFEYIYPQVSGVRLTSNLGSVSLTSKLLYNTNMSDIQDNKVYAEYYETSDTSKSILGTKEQITSGRSDSNQDLSFSFDSLQLSTGYTFRIYANLKDKDNNYVKSYLLDSDNNVNGREYTITTEGNMTINNGSHTIVATSSTKQVTFKFKLSATLGFKELNYSLYSFTGDAVSSSPLGVTINKDVVGTNTITTNMTKGVAIDPSNSFIFGSKYRLKIEAKGFPATAGGADPVITSYDYDFTLDELEKPYASGYYYNDSSAQKFRTTVNDPKGTIRDQKYSITIKDSSDNSVTVAGVTDSTFDVSEVNKEHTLSGLTLNADYKLIITMLADLKWDNSNTQIEREIPFKPIPDSSASVGQVFFDVHTNDLSIIFTNSVGMNLVNYYTATIYDPDGQVSTFTDTAFTSTISGNERTITLNYKATKRGVYNIQMEFRDLKSTESGSKKITEYTGYFRKSSGTFFSITNKSYNSDLVAFMERKTKLI